MDAKPNLKPKSDPEIFRANLEVITNQRGKGWVAHHLGMESKIIYRWLKMGIKRPDRRTQAVIEALAKLAELDDWQDLWRVKLEDHRKVNREAHENLDKWLADPYMVDATKAALKVLALRSIQIRTVDELLRPHYIKLGGEGLRRIASKYNPTQVIEVAVEAWKRDRAKFDPAEFLRTLADKIK